jgi:mono/diheme cytochrome c family protein
MVRAVCVLSMLLAPAISVSAQESKPAAGTSGAEYKIPPEAAKLANPVKPTPASIAQGKKLYDIDCEVCHGKDGDGKGDLAADMKVKLADYRDPAALKDRTDGELFYIIKNGKGEMPSEGDRGKPEAMWNLVNYIRSLAKKESSTK